VAMPHRFTAPAVHLLSRRPKEDMTEGQLREQAPLEAGVFETALKRLPRGEVVDIPARRRRLAPLPGQHGLTGSARNAPSSRPAGPDGECTPSTGVETGEGGIRTRGGGVYPHDGLEVR